MYRREGYTMKCLADKPLVTNKGSKEDWISILLHEFQDVKVETQRKSYCYDINHHFLEAFRFLVIIRMQHLTGHILGFLVWKNIGRSSRNSVSSLFSCYFLPLEN